MACVDKTGEPVVPMHYVHAKGEGKDHNLCFIRHHEERYLGLKRKYCSLVGKKLKDWKEPRKQDLEANERHVKRLKMEDERTT